METVAGWAKLLGISRYKCRRILEAAGVQIRQFGPFKVVYLSDLRKMNPDLWESFRVRRELGNDDAGE